MTSSFFYTQDQCLGPGWAGPLLLCRHLVLIPLDVLAFVFLMLSPATGTLHEPFPLSGTILQHSPPFHQLTPQPPSNLSSNVASLEGLSLTLRLDELLLLVLLGHCATFSQGSDLSFSCLFVNLSPPNSKLHKSEHRVDLLPSLWSWCLPRCLTYDKCSIFVSWMNESVSGSTKELHCHQFLSLSVIGKLQINQSLL